MSTAGDFVNKVAIVTGSSSGIGQTIAIFLAKKGASVVLCGRDEDRLKSALDECVEASGGHAERFIFVTGDLRDAEVRKATVDETIATFQRLDIFVANAGIVKKAELGDPWTEEMFDELFAVNVKSPFFLIQNALPHLEKSQGNITFVSSYASTVTLPYNPVFFMTTAAIDHMARCLALDHASKGIRVNTVNSSHVRGTRIIRDHIDHEYIDKIVEQERAGHILRGEFVTAEAVAQAITFLASDSAKFVTGQRFVVDGGRSFYGSGTALYEA